MAITDERLLARLLFDSVGGYRFTQDTPIFPDVWFAFAKHPIGPQTLILTPTRQASAGKVAKEIRKNLKELRGEESKNGEPLWRPMTEVFDRKSSQVIHLPGQVSARVYFYELMRIVLALTPWWDRRVAKVREEGGDLKGFPDYLDMPDKKLDTEDKKKARMQNHLADALESLRQSPGGSRRRRFGTHRRHSMEPTDDLIWVVRLAGAIALSHEWKDDDRGPFEDVLKEYLAGPPAEEGRSEETASPQREVSELSAELAGAFLDIYRDWPLESDKPESLLWRVTLNRKADAALERSRLVVKADAAWLLFDVSCSEINWAIVDSGIERNHPAFIDWDDQSSRTKNPKSRVVRTFDFTGLKELLDPDVIGEEKLPESDEVRQLVDMLKHRRISAAEGAIDGDALTDDILEDIEELRRRIRSGHEIDWGLLERFIEDKNPEPPRNDHGTHVAGVLGADWREPVDNGGDRSANADQPDDKDAQQEYEVVMQGICPDIRLTDVRVLRPDGQSDEFEVMAAIQYLRYRNARAGYMDVHGANLSLSIPHAVANYACGCTPICDECEEAVALGMVIVAAAGNHGYTRYLTRDGVAEGYRTVSVTDPGNAEGVITVGSTHGRSPHRYGVSYFSSRGPTGDGRIKPDLVAPGEKILGPVLDGGDGYKDGTSMAAPHVSGAAAMIMARHKELIGQPTRIKSILCDTATDLGRERYFQGYGLLDILRALQSI